MTRPVPTHRAGLLELLLEMVRMEFRVEVFRPDPDDPVFTAGRCRVSVRRRRLDYGRVGLCPIHQMAWKGAGKPDLEQWMPSQGHGTTQHRWLPALPGRGLQPGLWSRRALRPPPRLLGQGGPTGRCRVGGRGDLRSVPARGGSLRFFVGCERNADVKAGFCSGHHARWKQAGMPEDWFSGTVVGLSTPGAQRTLDPADAFIAAIERLAPAG
ncbi:hypothetical protein [Pseudonocardia humida]|uniref:Uncharacterized protein n=1 Tax=Pseudonocardia humida TaxID=2800819 RepID=A0ABT1A238_9PSEU|nr:hypothetical protein [Pseudonocardia humida]MCO1657069.1 hypothetical protein [Pseudonocardia humida]